MGFIPRRRIKENLNQVDVFVDDLKNDYKLYGNIDKGKLTKLRLQGNAKTSDDVDTIIKKNVLYLTNIFFQENTIITIDGIDKQILSAKIITTKNDDINADILTNKYRNERLRISYQRAIRLPGEPGRMAKAVVKRYLYSHMKSQVRIVTPDEWVIAVLLPVQRFRKASTSKVYNRTKKLYKV